MHDTCLCQMDNTMTSTEQKICKYMSSYDAYRSIGSTNCEPTSEGVDIIFQSQGLAFSPSHHEVIESMLSLYMGRCVNVSLLVFLVKFITKLFRLIEWENSYS